MRTRLWLVPALMLTAAPAVAETATQAFARLPPLATTAAPNMDCSAADVTAKKVEAALRPMSQTPTSFGGSAVNMTPAQMQAMAAIGDPAFNECLMQLQTNPNEWVDASKGQLQAKLDKIRADFNKAVEDFCRKQNSEACIGDPAIGKRFNAQAIAAGTQFLKDVQPQYAKHLKEVGDCVAMRDKAMGGATGGGNPALDAIFASSTGVTWGLLNVPAATNTRLCEAARDAAQTLAPAD